MPLTSQQFADVVAALRAETARGRDHELRTATRIEVNCKVVIWPVDERGKPGDARSVLARDLSLSGIGLLGPVVMKSGEQFIAGLPRPRQQPILVRCTARHCRELADGLYAIGALYDNVVERARATPAAPAAAAAAEPDPATAPVPDASPK